MLINSQDNIRTTHNNKRITKIILWRKMASVFKKSSAFRTFHIFKKSKMNHFTNSNYVSYGERAIENVSKFVCKRRNNTWDFIPSNHFPLFLFTVTCKSFFTYLYLIYLYLFIYLFYRDRFKKKNVYIVTQLMQRIVLNGSTPQQFR